MKSAATPLLALLGLAAAACGGQTASSARPATPAAGSALPPSPDLAHLEQHDSDDSEDAPSAYIAIRTESIEAAYGVDGKRVAALIASHVEAHPALTTDAKSASALGLDSYVIDVSARYQRRHRRHVAFAELELRLALSNHRGQMLSVWSRGARVQASRSDKDQALWDQAIDVAIAGAPEHIVSLVTPRETALLTPAR